MTDMSSSDLSAYETLERARLLCTRGHGCMPLVDEVNMAQKALPNLEERLIDLIEDY